MLPDSACSCLSGLQRRAGQRPLVCYGWRGGGHPPVLLSSGQPLLSSLPQSSLSLSLSLVWISCLVRSRQPRWEQWELFRGGVTSLCYHQMGTQKCQPPKQIVETFSCCSLRIVRAEHCRIKINTMPPKSPKIFIQLLVTFGILISREHFVVKCKDCHFKIQ